MTLVKKISKTTSRNPIGTPADQLRCPYYHQMYYTLLGHKNCSFPLCGRKTKIKEERAVALKVILGEGIDQEVKRNATLVCKFFLN